MRSSKPILAAVLAAFSTLAAVAESPLVYEGGAGPGKGKHIVFLAGDEEYRSEEALPMMAKILATRHGFKCTVLFCINPKTGNIDPLVTTNLPGTEALASADLCFMSLRFRDLPEDQMKPIVDYVNAGKAIIALRTSTHAFAINANKSGPYAKYDWQSKSWPGGFGQQILGETWINHHGDHGKQSTRGVLNSNVAIHPVLKGVTDIWGPTDVYGVIHLPADATVLVQGQVLTGMNPADAPLPGPKNDPMMPLIWLREHDFGSGKASRIVTSTIGAAVDLQSDGLRRLLVNACYWATRIEAKIPDKADVSYVGPYTPRYFGFGKFQEGLKPSDLRLQ
ncbi:MAG: hypothetical protein WCR20_10410 [Verrucomicrobiota bacterium]